MTREEAIDIIKCLAWHTRPNEEDIEQAIESLSTESCEELEFIQPHKKVSVNLEVCTDTINRQAVMDELNCLGRNAFKDDTDYDNFFAFVDNLPPVTPKQKMGKWIIVDDCEHFIAKCSECGRIEDSRMIRKYPYCHCGAKMEESEDRE